MSLVSRQNLGNCPIAKARETAETQYLFFLEIDAYVFVP